ncbi:MAG TPA: TIGR00153 family protein [Calditrichae bacterium]|nr:TIGR00153 family protein [Calditrichia bacterium]
MSVLANLFRKSPFTPLQTHMERVVKCVHRMQDLYDAHFQGDFEQVNKLAEEISELEHLADIAKNEIRNNLPRGLFLPVNRGDLLEILSLQDSIADKAEDVAILMTLKPLPQIEPLKEDMKNFMLKNIEAVEKTHDIIREMDELLESAFGGTEAEKVIRMVEEVAFMEHEADIMQHKILKELFSMEETLSYSSFYLWINILQTMASLANLAEKLANRVRMLLEVR